MTSRLLLLATAGLAAALMLSACGGSDADDVALPEGWTFELADPTAGDASADEAAGRPQPFSGQEVDPSVVIPSTAEAEVVEPDLAEPEPSSPTPEPTPEAEPASNSELAQRWWQWAALETWETSPLSDSDGSECAANQPADVWFLAPSIGGEVERACAVPADRELFVPVLARWCEPAGECAFTDPEGAAVLDGQALELTSISNSDPYEVAGPEGNPVTPSSSPMAVIDTGWWVRIPPLGSGSHELVVYASSLELESAVRYQLTVG